MDDEQMRDFVRNHRWQFAKNYAKKCPHEYVVRKWMNTQDEVDEFIRVAQYITDSGFMAYYYTRCGKYYILDDKYYWTMEMPIENTTVINRANMADYDNLNSCWIWKGLSDIERYIAFITGIKAQTKMDQWRSDAEKRFVQTHFMEDPRKQGFKTSQPL